MSLIASGRAEASPIGEATQFEEAIAEFTMTEPDWRAFVDAIKADRISASTPGLFLGSVIGASGPGGPASGPLLRTIAHLVLRRTECCQNDLTGAPLISEGSGFYERNSAVRIGEVPSDAVPRILRIFSKQSHN